MNKNKLAALVAGTALAALAAGCAETTTNSNANGNTVPSNTAVVTNNNGNTNTAGVTTTNTNTSTTRRTYNANISQAEYEKDKERFTKEAKDLGDKIGTAATDGWLWVKTKGALAAVDDLRDSTINVDVDNGVITLRGSVATPAQKSAAEKTAQGIEGKKSVKNQLAVSASGNTNKNANEAHSNANKKG